MSKKDVMEDVLKRARRKDQLKKEVAERHNNVESYVLKTLQEIDDMIASLTGTELASDADSLANFYVKALQGRINAIDLGARVTITWEGEHCDTPRINGVLISWSKEYQDKHNVDPELYVDIAQLLFKS